MPSTDLRKSVENYPIEVLSFGIVFVSFLSNNEIPKLICIYREKAHFLWLMILRFKSVVRWTPFSKALDGGTPEENSGERVVGRSALFMIGKKEEKKKGLGSQGSLQGFDLVA